MRIHLYCFTTKSLITCYSSKKKLIQLTNTHILRFLRQTPSGENQDSTLPESLLILDSYQLLLNLTKNQSPPYLNSALCTPGHCCRNGTHCSCSVRYTGEQGAGRQKQEVYDFRVWFSLLVKLIKKNQPREKLTWSRNMRVFHTGPNPKG